MTAMMSPAAFEAALRAVGAERYHDKHPFHRLLHTGKLNKGQVQAWALNRYVYQAHIPIKDAALIARCPDPALRRAWRSRLTEAPQDSAFALAYCIENARTPAEQKAVIDALKFKCGVLWSMLDALHFAYVAPGLVPPGAFVPQG